MTGSSILVEAVELELVKEVARRGELKQKGGWGDCSSFLSLEANTANPPCCAGSAAPKYFTNVSQMQTFFQLFSSLKCLIW